MNSDKDFFTNFYNLQLENRLKFFILIWHTGKFASSIENELDLTNKESIHKFGEIIQNLGFLSIENKFNADTQQIENYYYISYKNFENMFFHVLDKAHVKDDIQAFNIVLDDRKNIDPLLISKLSMKISNDRVLSREKFITLLEKNIAFFFLFILRLSPTIASNDYFSNFLNELFLKFVIDHSTFVSRNLWDLIDVNY